MRTVLVVSVSLLVLVLAPIRVLAQNTTFAGAQNLVAGQRAVTFSLTGGARYYVFNAVAGRSYCAEMVATTETTVVAASGLTILRANQAQIVSNNDTQEEPYSGRNAAGGG